MAVRRLRRAKPQHDTFAFEAATGEAHRSNPQASQKPLVECSLTAFGQAGP